MSFIIGAAANGTKLKLLTVLKDGNRARGRLPFNLVSTNTPTGHLNNNASSMYLTHVLRPYLQEFQVGETGSLFLDNFPSFKNETFKSTCEEIMMEPFFYPLNCREELNPSKVWLDDFKDCLLHTWTQYCELVGNGKRGYALWPGYLKVKLNFGIKRFLRSLSGSGRHMKSQTLAKSSCQ